MFSNAGNSTDDLLEKFQKRFYCLSNNGIDYDCEFIVGAERTVVKGHKLIFAASSEVFQAMFYGALKEDNIVTVPDIHPEVFECMKQFIYTCKIEFTSTIQALLVYVAARKYLIPVLTQLCSKYLKANIAPADVLEVYECCKTFNVSEFEELCCNIIREKTRLVVVSEYFLSVKPETIELILKSPKLDLGSEFDVFDLFERWALAEASRNGIAVEDMAMSFSTLKKHIQFLTISGKEFVSRVDKSPVLTQEEKLAIRCNKIDLNEVPVNLSSKLQKRQFITITPVPVHTSSESYFCFRVALFNTRCRVNYLASHTFTFSELNLRLDFEAIKLCDHICFEIRTIFGSDFMKSNYKFEVIMTAVDVEDETNNIHKVEEFWNTLKRFVNGDKFTIAAFPLSELEVNNRTYCRWNAVLVDIRCQIKIKKM